MKWITREKVKVDRVACPWLIKKFVDAEAEFFFAPVAAEGEKHREAIWFRDADTAEKLDLVLFIGLADWYPPQYDCGACGYATCAEFLNARQYHKTPSSSDWQFDGPVCQLRAIDLGIAVGSAAKTASINNIDTRCQTRLAAAARHLKIIRADLAVALSMSVTHKSIFFDKKMPEVSFADGPAPTH